MVNIYRKLNCIRKPTVLCGQSLCSDYYRCFFYSRLVFDQRRANLDRYNDAHIYDMGRAILLWYDLCGYFCRKYIYNRCIFNEQWADLGSRNYAIVFNLERTCMLHVFLLHGHVEIIYYYRCLYNQRRDIMDFYDDSRICNYLVRPGLHVGGKLCGSAYSLGSQHARVQYQRRANMDDRSGCGGSVGVGQLRDGVWKHDLYCGWRVGYGEVFFDGGI